MVCTIDETTITKGKELKLTDSSNNSYEMSMQISVVSLKENKVFIAHGYLYGTYLRGLICTISETTITKGTDIQLTDTQMCGKITSVVALTENKVFIAHGKNTNPLLYGMICEIEGTTITARNRYQVK